MAVKALDYLSTGHFADKAADSVTFLKPSMVESIKKKQFGTSAAVVVALARGIFSFF
jgi:hypothetical protein